MPGVGVGLSGCLEAYDSVQTLALPPTITLNQTLNQTLALSPPNTKEPPCTKLMMGRGGEPWIRVWFRESELWIRVRVQG